MYGTVTVLTASDPARREGIRAGLGALLGELEEAPGLVSVDVLAATPEQLVMVTVYRSETDAEALSRRVRPRLAELVGPHLAGPPERFAGPTVLSTR